MGHHPKESESRRRLNSDEISKPILTKTSKKSTTELQPSSTKNGDDKGTMFREKKKKKEKVVITGDDILIEYVRRLKNVVNKTNSSILPNSIMYYLEKFLYHKVWSIHEQNKTAE